jgi:hypothetical protein
MNIASLFMKNMEPNGISHVYDGAWTDKERNTIDPLMSVWTEGWLSPGFNTWTLVKSGNKYFAKRFTWDYFDIMEIEFDKFVQELTNYHERW